MSTQLKRPRVASARSNTERPIGAAPTARLIHDLNRIKEQRRQRTAKPIFSPERASRQGCRRLIREAMTLSGDLQITGDTVHLRLNPASAPRRSRALAALCDQLTATETIYPDTNLKIEYSVKGHYGTS